MGFKDDVANAVAEQHEARSFACALVRKLNRDLSAEDAAEALELIASREYSLSDIVRVLRKRGIYTTVSRLSEHSGGICSCR